MKIIHILLLIIFIMGCKNKEQKLSELVENWQQREIIFPKSLKAKIYGQDTVCKDLFVRKYKILNYIDTNTCITCHLKLYEWRLLKQRVDSLHLDVSFIFIAHLKYYKELEAMQRISLFNAPFLYDFTGETDKQNHFPTNPTLQTFLLDSLNRVVLIGNPIGNKKLWDLYIKKMKE